MKPFRLILCLSIMVVIVLFGIWYFCDVWSPWSSPGKVKNWLLGLAPMGSSVEKVKSAIATHHWKQIYERSFEESTSSMHIFPGVKGTHAIGVDFGEHFAIPFSYGVDAYWGFDATGKLIDVKVRVIPNAL
jgi:hypothetical protein